MKGIIFVNPFGVPKESIFQAERLKEEFSELGTAIDIVSDGYAVNAIVGDGTTLNFSCDFAVFLDKDKYLSACLEKAGVRLFNSHAAIRSCDDKGETYIALLGGGLNIPKTFFAPVCYSQTLPLDEKTLKNIADELGYPVVVKESFGSMGKGVYKADDFEELKAVAEKLKTKPHIYQEFLSEGSGKDVRLIVIGGKFLCAMIRENKNDFRSNVALGGVGRAFSPNAQFIAAAEKCANILGLDYCGVDLLFGKDGKPYVCEVNSNAFISEIERVTGVNVARAYAEYIVKALSSAK
ncbi:MAG: RimK family alpha-L-glutamate ligase [Clostridia bacterium]|nr:RimK family alpha-L-glutamate ligase [Clostridia bacterium]